MTRHCEKKDVVSVHRSLPQKMLSRRHGDLPVLLHVRASIAKWCARYANWDNGSG